MYITRKHNQYNTNIYISLLHYTMFFPVSPANTAFAVSSSNTGSNHHPLLLAPNTDSKFFLTPASFVDSDGNVHGHGNLASFVLWTRLFFCAWYHSIVVQLCSICIICHSSKYATELPSTISSNPTTPTTTSDVLDQSLGEDRTTFAASSTQSNSETVVYRRNST